MSRASASLTIVHQAPASSREVITVSSTPSPMYRMTRHGARPFSLVNHVSIRRMMRRRLWRGNSGRTFLTSPIINTISGVACNCRVSSTAYSPELASLGNKPKSSGQGEGRGNYGKRLFSFTERRSLNARGAGLACKVATYGSPTLRAA